MTQIVFIAIYRFDWDAWTLTSRVLQKKKNGHSCIMTNLTPDDCLDDSYQLEENDLNQSQEQDTEDNDNIGGWLQILMPMVYSWVVRAHDFEYGTHEFESWSRRPNFVRRGGHAMGNIIASSLVVSDFASDPRYKC